MRLFSPRPKVHLSPSLARTIGQNTKSKYSYLWQLGLVVVLVAVLFIARSGKGNLATSLRSNVKADVADGQVLGDQTSRVLNYQVTGGDTLTGISQKYNVYWMSIVEENDLQPPYALTPGQTLRIPLPRN